MAQPPRQTVNRLEHRGLRNILGSVRHPMQRRMAGRWIRIDGIDRRLFVSRFAIPEPRIRPRRGRVLHPRSQKIFQTPGRSSDLGGDPPKRLAHSSDQIETKPDLVNPIKKTDGKMKKLLIAAALFTLAGCTDQRDLYSISTPMLSIESDWMPSLSIEDMSGNATAMLYKNGELTAKSFFFSPTSATANVRSGDYEVLIFNGQMFSEEQTNLDFIAFRNTGFAETFEAFSVRTTPNDRLVRSPEEHLVNNEMAILTSAYARKRIDADPQFYLKYENGHRVDNDAEVAHIEDSISFTPIALTHRAQVFVRLTNPASAAVANGALRGFARSVYLASGRPSHLEGTHQLRLNSLRLTGLNTGVIESPVFTTFGPPLDLGTNRRYVFELSVILTDGRLFETTVDITDQVRGAISQIINNRANRIYSPADIVIEIDVELPVTEGGSGVGVNPWQDDEVITIKV